eukprot:SAG11_NODE_33846_length_275_cov_0.585227_1_plen_58_part_00
MIIHDIVLYLLVVPGTGYYSEKDDKIFFSTKERVYFTKFSIFNINRNSYNGEKQYQR